jgi:hypothetical protein
MNNEPVAWMTENGTIFDELPPISGGLIPLYTHPAKELDEQFKKGFETGKEEGWKAHKFHHPAKTLTDEEIYEIGDDFVDNAFDKQGYSEFDRIGFARAILRKAQEK